MRRLGLCTLWILFMTVLDVGGAGAQARGQAADRERARVSYARGQELFREGRFAEAQASFQDAYDTIPLPIVLLGIAEAQERQGNALGTVETLTRYLRERQNAPDRVQVEGRITALREKPATLVISTSPPGATVRVDGNVVARLLSHPVEVEVAPGEHRVEAELAGRTPVSQTVEATFGTRHELQLTLAAAAEPPAPTPAVAAAAASTPSAGAGRGDESTSVPTAAWVTGSVAVAGVVAGTVLGFMALSEQSKFDDNPTAGTADRGERLALFADLSFVLAGIAGLTTIVLLVTDDGSGEDSRGTAGLSLQPAVSANGAGVMASGSF